MHASLTFSSWRYIAYVLFPEAISAPFGRTHKQRDTTQPDETSQAKFKFRLGCVEFRICNFKPAKDPNRYLNLSSSNYGTRLLT